MRTNVLKNNLSITEKTNNLIKKAWLLSCRKFIHDQYIVNEKLVNNLSILS